MMKLPLLLLAVTLQTSQSKDDFFLPEEQATLSYSISRVQKPYQAVLGSGEGGSALEISGTNNVSREKTWWSTAMSRQADTGKRWM